MYTLRKSFPSHQLQPCSKYNKSNKHQYLLDCPTTGSNGCLTKFEGELNIPHTITLSYFTPRGLFFICLCFSEWFRHEILCTDSYRGLQGGQWSELLLL